MSKGLLVFSKNGMSVQVMLYEGRPISLDLPPSVMLEVTETDPDSVRRADAVLLATTTLPADDALADLARQTDVPDYFITEACEYVDSFLELAPKIEIILNIDSDHLEFRPGGVG